MLKKFLKEPLLHFLLLALLLFVLFDVLNPPQEEARVITISQGRVEQLINRFQKTWQRLPSNEELAMQLRNYALDEIYNREARALGLDKNDAVVKRRLRQKMEFMLQDTIPQEPTQEELEAFYQKNQDKYRIEPRYSFEQVFVSLDRGQAELDAILTEQERQLAAGTRPTGDTTLLPAAMDSTSETGIERQFGIDFLKAITGLDTGVWQGPIRSGLGLHYVKITQVEKGELPILAAVYPRVFDDWKYQKSSEAKTLFEEALLKRYEVRIEENVNNEESAG